MYEILTLYLVAHPGFATRKGLPRPSPVQPRRPPRSCSSSSPPCRMRPPGGSQSGSLSADQRSNVPISQRLGPPNPISQNKGKRDKTWRIAMFKPGKDATRLHPALYDVGRLRAHLGRPRCPHSFPRLLTVIFFGGARGLKSGPGLNVLHRRRRLLRHHRFCRYHGQHTPPPHAARRAAARAGCRLQLKIYMPYVFRAGGLALSTNEISRWPGRPVGLMVGRVWGSTPLGGTAVGSPL